MKNFFTYPVFLVIFLSIVGSMFFGALLRHHYLGGGRAESLQKIAVFLLAYLQEHEIWLSTKILIEDQ